MSEPTARAIERSLTRRDVEATIIPEKTSPPAGCLAEHQVAHGDDSGRD